jgi:hypothetical protein
MGAPEGTRDSAARIQITVAVIGLLGVIAAALISNWNNIFPKTAPVQTSAKSSPAPLTKKPERAIYSSGQMEVRGTWLCDLDIGAQAQNQASADFQWEQDTAVNRSLTPENNAAFFLVGLRDFDSVKYADLERFPYSTQKIEADAVLSNPMPQGSVVAYRTNEGRLGKLLVVGYGYNLTIRWITYQK